MQENKIMYLVYAPNKRESEIVYEDGSRKIMGLRPESILNRICYRYGMTLHQRQSFIRWRFLYKQKTPLLLDLKREIIFFPLFGRRCEEAIWIQYRFVQKVRMKASNAVVFFKNNTMLVVPLHYRSVQKQMRRCKEIIKVLSQI